MRRSKAILLSVSLLGLWLTSPLSAFASIGTEGASFMDMPVGAGPAALGGSYAARATNVYGLVWNPAGLGRMRGYEMTAQHLDYVEAIHYEFAGAAVSLRPGSTLGGGIQYLGSGDIQKTDDFGNQAGDFSTHYAAYSLAFGQALGEDWSLGITSKFIEAQLNDVHAHAFAGDIGSLYRPNDRWSFAMTTVNLGSPLTFIDQKDPLPLAFRGAFLYTPTNHWNFSVDGAYRRSGLASAHTGVEWRPLPVLILRAGYRTDTLKELSPLAGFGAGIGLDLWGQELAYAFVPMGDLGITQYVSLLLKFGQPAQEGQKNLVYLPDIHRPHRVKETPATVRNYPSSQYSEVFDLLSGEVQ